MFKKFVIKNRKVIVSFMFGMAILAVILLNDSLSVKAATGSEANSDTHTWETNFQDGTGVHHMLNKLFQYRS